VSSGKTTRRQISAGFIEKPYVTIRACEQRENGAEQAEKRLERSGSVSGVQKIKWSVSGAGDRQSGNGAVSGSPVNGAER